MIKLDLNSRAAIRLPASAFPEFADAYVCDKCGRDITSNLRRSPHPHGLVVGRETFLCSCGEEYRTNAMEWDSLGRVGKRQQVVITTVMGLCLSLVSSILAIPVYFILRLFVPTLAVVIGVAIGAAPLVFLQITFWLPVLASVWRTRIASDRKRSRV